MESATNLVKNGQTIADKAADKVQSGIRTAQDAGSALSSRVDEIRGDAGPVLARASGRVQSTAKQGFDALTDMASQAREAAANASDSIVAYTKKNPAKSLAIAAGVGALLYAAIKAVRSSRD